MEPAPAVKHSHEPAPGTAAAQSGSDHEWSPEEVAWDGVLLQAKSVGKVNIGPQQRQAAPAALCQVPGCKSDMRSSRMYHIRHKICEFHARMGTIIIDGKLQRFCQLCARFHAVSMFDSTRRTCREKLKLHNERRRNARALAKATDAKPKSAHSHVICNEILDLLHIPVTDPPHPYPSTTHPQNTLPPTATTPYTDAMNSAYHLSEQQILSLQPHPSLYPDTQDYLYHPLPPPPDHPQLHAPITAPAPTHPNSWSFPSHPQPTSRQQPAAAPVPGSFYQRQVGAHSPHRPTLPFPSMHHIQRNGASGAMAYPLAYQPHLLHPHTLHSHVAHPHPASTLDIDSAPTHPTLDPTLPLLPAHPPTGANPPLLRTQAPTGTMAPLLPVHSVTCSNPSLLPTHSPTNSSHTLASTISPSGSIHVNLPNQSPTNSNPTSTHSHPNTHSCSPPTPPDSIVSNSPPHAPHNSLPLSLPPLAHYTDPEDPHLATHLLPPSTMYPPSSHPSPYSIHDSLYPPGPTPLAAPVDDALLAALLANHHHHPTNPCFPPPNSIDPSPHPHPRAPPHKTSTPPALFYDDPLPALLDTFHPDSAPSPPPLPSSPDIASTYQCLHTLSFKLFDVTPEDLPPLLLQDLLQIVGNLVHMEGCIRPGCVQLTLDTFRPPYAPPLAAHQLAEQLAARPPSWRTSRVLVQVGGHAVELRDGRVLRRSGADAVAPTIQRAGDACVAPGGRVVVRCGNVDAANMQLFCRAGGSYFKVEGWVVEEGAEDAAGGIEGQVLVSFQLPDVGHHAMVHVEVAAGNGMLAHEVVLTSGNPSLVPEINRLADPSISGAAAPNILTSVGRLLDLSLWLQHRYNSAHTLSTPEPHPAESHPTRIVGAAHTLQSPSLHPAALPSTPLPKAPIPTILEPPPPCPVSSAATPAPRPSPSVDPAPPPAAPNPGRYTPQQLGSLVWAARQLLPLACRLSAINLFGELVMLASVSSPDATHMLGAVRALTPGGLSLLHMAIASQDVATVNVVLQWGWQYGVDWAADVQAGGAALLEQAARMDDGGAMVALLQGVLAAEGSQASSEGPTGVPHDAPSGHPLQYNADDLSDVSSDLPSDEEPEYEVDEPLFAATAAAGGAAAAAAAVAAVALVAGAEHSGGGAAEPGAVALATTAAAAVPEAVHTAAGDAVGDGGAASAAAGDGAAGDAAAAGASTGPAAGGAAAGDAGGDAGGDAAGDAGGDAGGAAGGDAGGAAAGSSSAGAVEWDGAPPGPSDEPEDLKAALRGARAGSGKLDDVEAGSGKAAAWEDGGSAGAGGAEKGGSSFWEEDECLKPHSSLQGSGKPYPQAPALPHAKQLQRYLRARSRTAPRVLGLGQLLLVVVGIVVVISGLTSLQCAIEAFTARL